MGIFNHNKNPKKGFREQPKKKPVTRKARAKDLRKKGFKDAQIEYFFMLEDNATIANTEFNKVCAQIQRLGFKPQVQLDWHGTGCDSKIMLVPIPIPEWEALNARWAKEEKKKSENGVVSDEECSECFVKKGERHVQGCSLFVPEEKTAKGAEGIDRADEPKKTEDDTMKEVVEMDKKTELNSDVAGEAVNDNNGDDEEK